MTGTSTTMGPRTHRDAGLVLAAGQGLRFGRPKALVEVEGERLVDRSVDLLRSAGCSPVVVVTGAAEVDVPRALVVHNPDWASGMASSLRAGLAALPADAERVAVVLVDTPWLSSVAVARVLAAAPAGAAVATYDGRRGHPVVLARAVWGEVAALASGDDAARIWMRAHPDRVVEVDCTGLGDPRDVDRPQDLPG